MKNFRGEILKILDGHIDENYIEKFLNLNPVGIFIIRVNGHLTCAIDGTLYDIWDCRNEIIDIVWKVE